MQQNTAPHSSYDRSRTSLSVEEFNRRLEALCADGNRELTDARARLEAWQRGTGEDLADAYLG